MATSSDLEGKVVKSVEIHPYEIAVTFEDGTVFTVIGGFFDGELRICLDKP